MDEENNNEIGENIYRLRVAAELSQSQLAERLGLTRSAISQYESGRIKPRMGTVEKLANVFSVPKTDIIGPAPGTGQPADDAAMALADDEKALVDLYRRCTDQNKHAIMVVAESLSAQ